MVIYSIKWNGSIVKSGSRCSFMHEGNQLFGKVVGWNRTFTNLLVEVCIYG